MIIKKATKNEYNIFCQFAKELDQYHRRAHPEMVKPEKKISRSRKWFEETIRDKNQFLLLGYEDNKPIGFIHFEIVPVKSHPVLLTFKHINLHNIFVDKKYRRQQYGKIFFTEMLSFAKKNKIDQIWINVWSFNDAAIYFYKKMGFSPFSIKMRLQTKYKK
jgi:diamine N-acetyltransferase